MSGVIVKNMIGVPSETVQSGPFLTGFRDKEIEEYTRKVFSSNESKTVNMQALNEFLSFLGDLLHFFTKENTRSFVSTSIIVIVDNIAKSHIFKLIDFNYVDPLPEGTPRDSNVILGIENIILLIQKILKEENEKSALSE